MTSVSSLSKEIVHTLEEALKNIGVMYRVFCRVKASSSLAKKIASDDRYGKEKLIQDGIGIRIVLYFVDDVDIVRNVVSNIYKERTEDASIDNFSANEFRARRYNIVYEVESDGECPLKRELGDFIDSTFELQIRTILSEGWHEVEHDLRYKFALDWNGFIGYSRGMNGVLASLETNEWTMVRLLDDLSYGHYKSQNLISMMRQKLRLRISSYEIDDRLETELIKPRNFKKCHRIDRAKLLMQLSQFQLTYPVTLSNIIHFANLTQLHIPEVTKLASQQFIEEVTDAMQKFPSGERLSGIELARSIAEIAHSEQTRRNGLPYITHPESVAELVADPDAKCVAWLHDILEDCDVTPEHLQDRGVPENVITAVVAMTKVAGENYGDYISRVNSNVLAKKVKIADILHNLSDSPAPKNIPVYLGALETLLQPAVSDA